MIDFLVVTVVFLLMTFSASGDPVIPKGVALPKAENTLDMIDAPLVGVMGSQLLVNGQPAGTTHAIEESGRLQRVDELFNILKQQREMWKATHPAGKEFPGVVVLQIDQNVPAIVVKSVFQTAAFAGYPQVSFMVDQLPKSAH
jgi:biopolymer transport protein ExbD